MKYLNTYLKNGGFAIVATFLLILIILTLAAVLINISYSEFSQAELNKNDIKAYFLARSGAETLADYIIKTSPKSWSGSKSEVIIYDNNTNNKYNILSEIKINTSADTPPDFNLISTATVNGRKKTISVLVKKPELSAIYAKSELDLTKMTSVNVPPEQKVETKSSVIKYNDGDLNEDQIILNSDKKFVTVDWYNEYNKLFDDDENFDATNPLTIDDIPTDFNGSLINSSGYYGDLTYNPNDSLEINFDNNEIINIFVDTLSIKGTLECTGIDFPPDSNEYDEKLNIFVKESMTFQTPNVSLQNFNIFLMKDANLTLIGSTDTTTQNGIFVYGPEASMTLQSTVTFEGSIIVDQLIGKTDNSNPMGTFTYNGPPSQQALNYIKSKLGDYNAYYKANWSRE